MIHYVDRIGLGFLGTRLADILRADVDCLIKLSAGFGIRSNLVASRCLEHKLMCEPVFP